VRVVERLRCVGGLVPGELAAFDQRGQGRTKSRSRDRDLGSGGDEQRALARGDIAAADDDDSPAAEVQEDWEVVQDGRSERIG
jgi:hypothetical protein